VKCSLLLLSSYVDGELEASRRGELEAHLVACQRCRVGLAHLRNEAERIGSLARVHVPEHSARVLLEATGVIGAGDVLPPQPVAVAEARPQPELPPWLADAGASLPPTADRPLRQRRRNVAPQRRELAGAAARATDPGDVEIAGSAIPPIGADDPGRSMGAFLADVAALRKLVRPPAAPTRRVPPPPPSNAATYVPTEEAPPVAGGDAPF
jgi:anti-sigma factor RsiW